MRSIGVFRGSAQTLASDTAGHDNFSEMERRMARQRVKANSKPKVGVLSSSQVTQMRAVAPTTKTLDKVNFGGAQTTVVRNALNRVRNASCVAPKKKGFAPACSTARPARPTPVPPGPCPKLIPIALNDIATVDESGYQWYVNDGAVIQNCQTLTVQLFSETQEQVLILSPGTNLTNNGYVYINGGTFVLNPTSLFQNNGTMYVYNGGTLPAKGIGGIINNPGSIVVADGGSCGSGSISSGIEINVNPFIPGCP
jgi:hypothetical protein